MRYNPITVDRAREILASYAWGTPESYAGFSPIGDYCILTQHRDSDAMSRSNWQTALDLMWRASTGAYEPNDTFKNRADVYDWRASHCLVGWCEYLMVRSDAPDHVLILAAQIVDSIDQYPILDENQLEVLEAAEAQESWKHLDMRGRLEVIAGATYDGKPISPFAARHDYPPSDDSGLIGERLR